MPPATSRRPKASVVSSGPSKQFLSKEIRALLIVVLILALALLVLLLVFTSLFISTSTDDLLLLKHRTPKQTTQVLGTLKTANLVAVESGSKASGTATLKRENNTVSLEVTAQNLPKPTASQAYAVYLLGDKTHPRQFIGRIVQTSVGSGPVVYSMQGQGPEEWFNITGLEIALQNTVNTKRGEISTLSGNFEEQ